MLRGHDPAQKRDLALKVLLDEFAGLPDVVQRFREEAQIGGQLQHPGVVPVYELGLFDDGRPFFTMKLVKGVTLAALLRERPDPGHDRPRFLKVFEQVCQTVAYAHSKRVVHRDLKPGNVMVGAFGEVQVMDWGLAKVLRPVDGSGREQRETASRPGEIVSTAIKVTRPESAGSETQEGEVLGTPAYMPPEQALGEVDRLDERCDVFSLGAILCEVLTGKPPYVAGDGESVLRQARRANLADALTRLDGCGADAELTGLAKRCLAAEPSGRPRDASEVARSVEAYRAGVEERARRAELERAAAQARAKEAWAMAAAGRRARRLTAALKAAMLLFILPLVVWVSVRALDRYFSIERHRLELLAGKISAENRSLLRQQALDWLRSDLTAYTRLAEKGNKDAREAVWWRLTGWFRNPELAFYREEKSLAALPEAERQAWQKLWADVAALLKKVEGMR